MNPEELVEVLGLIAEKADNYLHGALLPLPAKIHAEGLVGGMEEIKKMANDAINALEEPTP